MLACPTCGQDNPDVARFCLACGTALAPADVRRERKVVTVLFADIVGFTTSAESLDPEDVGSMLERYHARVKHELERHGGTVEKFIGDAVMALFGAPAAHEDDPERAVRAALAIQARLADADDERWRDVSVRVGVTTGEAVVTLGAVPSEGQGMAAGDVVNTAARLQAAAPAGGVLVDEATRRATAEAVEYRAHDPVHAKGKAEPVSAWLAVAPRARFGVDVVQDVRTPLVGRRRELGVLADALARTRAERAPQLVTLVGVPGIGKSRLVWELFRLADADPDLITWRQGRCLPYGEGVAFSALGEMVKSQAGLLDTDTALEAETKLAATVAALVPDELEQAWVARHAAPLVGLGDSAASNELGDAFAAWRRLFEGLAEQRALVLVFEDLHWADDALLDFVDHLVDWATGVPLLALATARPELLERRPSWGGGKLNATTVALSPLAREDAARLVAGLLDQPLVPAPLQQALLERAEGNPLYAEQYVKMLADRGLLVREGRGWELPSTDELPLPETLQGIIAARLDALPPQEKALLHDASVVGKVFWAGALPGRDTSTPRLHALERKGFVRRERRSSVAGEAEYAFAHGLVRDVAYSQIPRADRAVKHARTAEWIERLAGGRPEDTANVAAHHWLRALELTRAAGRDDLELAARARRALNEAGDRARRLGAHDAAREAYGHALALTAADDPDRPRVLYRYGSAAAQAGIDADAELAEAASALLAAGDVEAAADATFARSWYPWNIGRNDAAWELTNEARRLVEGRPPSPAQAYIFGMYAMRSTLGARWDDALEYAARELALGRALGLDHHRVNALITKGTAQAVRGEAAGLDVLEDGLALARSVNDPPLVIRGFKNLASLLAVYADIRRAARLTEEALAFATRLGDAFHVGWFRVELGTYAYMRGDWDEALAHLDAFTTSLGDKRHYMEGPAQAVRGRIAAERGRVDAGMRDSARALEFARSLREAQQLLPALASHARVLLLAGRASDASTLLDELLATARQATPALGDAASALADLGRAADFERLGDDMEATRWGRPASALARGDYARAAELYQATGAFVLEADARARLAAVLAAAGRQAEARRERELAAVVFRRAGVSRPPAAHAAA